MGGGKGCLLLLLRDTRQEGTSNADKAKQQEKEKKRRWVDGRRRKAEGSSVKSWSNCAAPRAETQPNEKREDDDDRSDNNFHFQRIVDRTLKFVW